MAALARSALGVAVGTTDVRQASAAVVGSRMPAASASATSIRSPAAIETISCSISGPFCGVAFIACWRGCRSDRLDGGGTFRREARGRPRSFHINSTYGTSLKKTISYIARTIYYVVRSTLAVTVITIDSWGEHSGKTIKQAAHAMSPRGLRDYGVSAVAIGAGFWRPMQWPSKQAPQRRRRLK